mmetsp:Transcript_4212/g.12563  ORF Transcript_4212/g.12563 Transcript_4212/m.12563 type:complete len:476 (-) Transcript_4212:772-2199(-)
MTCEERYRKRQTPEGGRSASTSHHTPPPSNSLAARARHRRPLTGCHWRAGLVARLTTAAPNQSVEVKEEAVAKGRNGVVAIAVRRLSVARMGCLLLLLLLLLDHHPLPVRAARGCRRRSSVSVAVSRLGSHRCLLCRQWQRGARRRFLKRIAAGSLACGGLCRPLQRRAARHGSLARRRLRLRLRDGTPPSLIPGVAGGLGFGLARRTHAGSPRRLLLRRRLARRRLHRRGRLNLRPGLRLCLPGRRGLEADANAAVRRREDGHYDGERVLPAVVLGGAALGGDLERQVELERVPPRLFAERDVPRGDVEVEVGGGLNLGELDAQRQLARAASPALAGRLQPHVRPRAGQVGDAVLAAPVHEGVPRRSCRLGLESRRRWGERSGVPATCGWRRVSSVFCASIRSSSTAPASRPRRAGGSRRAGCSRTARSRPAVGSPARWTSPISLGSEAARGLPRHGAAALGDALLVALLPKVL